MNENELTVLVNNEIEWRKQLWKKTEQIELKQSEMDKVVNGLRVKVAVWGSVFGSIAGVVMSLFKHKF